MTQDSFLHGDYHAEPSYTPVEYGVMFRCSSEEIGLLKEIRRLLEGTMEQRVGIILALETLRANIQRLR